MLIKILDDATFKAIDAFWKVAITAENKLEDRYWIVSAALYEMFGIII